MQPGTGSTDKGQKSRRELTAIAIDCFARYGFQGSSVDRIARMAGVTKGAIYYHFRDKEDLLAAAVADRIGEFEQRVQRACEGQSGAEALRRVAEVCVTHAESNDHPRFIITLMVESIDTNEAISEQLREMMRRFRWFLRTLIGSAQERGEFRRDLDAKTVAAGFTSWMLGAEIQYYQDPQRFDLRGSLAVYLEQLLSDLRAEPCRPKETARQ